MKKHTQRINISGWFEVVYRNDDAPIPSGIQDIHPRDYAMVDMAFPMSEFERLFDVVEMFLKDRENVRRVIREFDAINFFRTAPTKGSCTMILIQPTRLKQFGHETSEVHTAAFTDLIMVPTRPQQRFASFRT